MRFKRLLALLLAAALALAVLVGCGSGQQSAAQALLKLLDGKYPNISIEIDPDLEADLRQAISQAEAENAGDDDAVIRAALEKLVGSTVTFRNLGDGQQGDTTFDLVFYAGTDPDKAAQAAYSQWNIVFANVPDDGKYGTGLAMVETNSGIWMLVKATVEKAGTVDKPDDDDDEPEPEKPKDPYTKNADGNYTVNTSNGLQELFADNPNSDFAGKTITLDAGTEYTVDTTNGPLAASFKGELQGNNATITLKKGSNGLFAQIGEAGGDSTSNGKVENITFDVQTTITNTYTESGAYAGAYAGAAAGRNYGEITNCDVTIGSNYTIKAASSSNVYAGGLVGENHGTITNCTVTIENGGSIQVNDASYAHAGGLVGYNGSGGSVDGTYSGSGKITATGELGANAGGLVGTNENTVTGTYSGSGDISATATSRSANAGGLVGFNGSGDTVTATYSGSGKITATATAANGSACAGGLVGRNDGNVTATYENKGSTITAQIGENGTPVGPNSKEIGGTGNFPASGNTYAGTEIGFQDA